MDTITTAFAWLGYTIAGLSALLVLVPVIRHPCRTLFHHLAGWLARWLTWRVVTGLLVAFAASIWAAYDRPFPLPGSNAVLDLIALQDPTGYRLISTWYLLTPGVVTFGAVLLLTGAWRVWIERRQPLRAHRATLPPWPTCPADPSPSLVVGELHHPTLPREAAAPDWLVIPERGLYTGLAIFGAVGSGKTSACMYPFAHQLFGWQADRPRRRAAGLVLEVKGDFCHDVRRILAEHGREEDYTELTLGGRWQWNPLASDLDSYSLAYTIAALLQQLFGRGNEPFWQQASTNLIRWIIELHRALPANWCTLRDVYRCAIHPDTFASRIKEAQAFATSSDIGETITLDRELWQQHYKADELAGTTWQPTGPSLMATPYTEELADRLLQLGLSFATTPPVVTDTDHAARVRAVARWYEHDWLQLDTKLRTSIVEGVSTFLSMFDLPDVARVFCPPVPASRTPTTSNPSSTSADVIPLLQPLPDLGDLIDAGKVVALNMPAGANPALARAIGVMLKNAWLQALLKRPAAMKAHPGRYYRPAVFVCDEYQSFATVGEDNPSGDEKSFALTRQCRCIPIVATQSISSLRSVLPGQTAWRALIQTLRTRIFLSLSDDASAVQASEMCGKVLRLRPSYSISETSKSGVSLVRARAGGGRSTVGTSKSFQETRDAVFHPRAFTLLNNFEGIAIPYDGARALPPTRVYLKPHFLPRDHPYWRAREAGDI